MILNCIFHEATHKEVIDDASESNNEDISNTFDNNQSQIPLEVERVDNNDGNTITSELASHASSRPT